MREITSGKAIQEAISEEMKRDEKVFVMGECVQRSTFSATTDLVGIFGTDRLIDTPISENGIAGAVIGASMLGYRPIGDLMMADFMLVAAAEIFMAGAKWHFNHAGKVKLPFVFLAMAGGGGGWGSDHSQVLTGFIMHTPGLKLVCPSNPYDAKGLLKTAIRDDNPVIFMFHKFALGAKADVPEEEYLIPFGKAAIKREGTDVTVVALCNMVPQSIAVADQLKGKISVEVIDPRTLVPLDIDTIVESVKKTGRLIVVDEDVEVAGITGEICQQVVERAFEYLDAPPVRLAHPNIPVPGFRLEQYTIPQQADIKAAIEAIV